MLAALKICAEEGWNCQDLTHDMAMEILTGNATAIDPMDPSVLTNGSPLDVIMFFASNVGTGGAPRVAKLTVGDKSMGAIHIMLRHAWETKATKVSKFSEGTDIWDISAMIQKTVAHGTQRLEEEGTKKLSQKVSRW